MVMKLDFKTIEQWKKVLMEPNTKTSVELSARVSVEVWLLISQAKMQEDPPASLNAVLLAEIEKVYAAYFWLQPRIVDEDEGYIAKRDKWQFIDPEGR